MNLHAGRYTRRRNLHLFVYGQWELAVRIVILVCVAARIPRAELHRRASNVIPSCKAGFGTTSVLPHQPLLTDRLSLLLRSRLCWLVPLSHRVSLIINSSSRQQRSSLKLQNSSTLLPELSQKSEQQCLPQLRRRSRVSGLFMSFCRETWCK